MGLGAKRVRTVMAFQGCGKGPEFYATAPARLTVGRDLWCNARLLRGRLTQR